MILVTGATGFVGYHLVNALVGRHKRVRCLVQTDEAKTRGIANDIEIVKGDIRDKDVVNNALKGVQQVVHLASVIENPNLEIVRQINAEGTKNLVQASLLCGVEQFIFFSTLNVILPVKNQYSMSKLEAEGIIKKSGLSFIILRPSIIYGRGDNGTIEKLISTVKTKKLVFLVGEGKYMLQPVFVDDVVRAVCEVLNNPHKFENRALFLVGREIVSYNDLVDLISNIIGVQRIKLHVPLSIIKGLVKLVSTFSKNGILLENKLKTYPFDKVVVGTLQKDVFPIQATPLRSGLTKSIGRFENIDRDCGQ